MVSTVAQFRIYARLKLEYVESSLTTIVCNIFVVVTCPGYVLFNIRLDSICVSLERGLIDQSRPLCLFLSVILVEFYVILVEFLPVLEISTQPSC
ncbi:MAG: hypothetical protein RL033_2271 [Pseudomonadota bacterium]|jgi:hypothetical protein